MATATTTAAAADFGVAAAHAGRGQARCVSWLAIHSGVHRERERERERARAPAGPRYVGLRYVAGRVCTLWYIVSAGAVVVETGCAVGCYRSCHGGHAVHAVHAIADRLSHRLSHTPIFKPPAHRFCFRCAYRSVSTFHRLTSSCGCMPGVVPCCCAGVCTPTRPCSSTARALLWMQKATIFPLRNRTEIMSSMR